MFEHQQFACCVQKTSGAKCGTLGFGVTHDTCDTGFLIKNFLYIFLYKIIIVFPARVRIFYKNMCHMCHVSQIEEVFKRVKQQLMEAAFDDDYILQQRK